MSARSVVPRAVVGVALALLSAVSAPPDEIDTPFLLVGGTATAVPLGTAAGFAVLAGSTVTSTGPTVVSGDLGVAPGTAITGFPPGVVDDGTQHAADAVAAQARSDLTTAYDNAAGQAADVAVGTELGGQILVPGVYNSGTLGLTGTVTLDGQNDPGSVFVLQAGSTLITASNSTVALTNGADACNVFWQVGSSATLGTGTTFRGTVMALTSITATTGTTVQGRLLARDGAVTLDSNTVDRSGCGDTPPGSLAISAPVGPVELGTTPGSAGPGGVGPSAIGGVTVTDERDLQEAGEWVASVRASAFTGAGSTIPATGISYQTPAAARAGPGSLSLTPSSVSDLTADRPVQTATEVRGNSTTTWNPTLSVDVPAGTPAGTYTATLTHSVL